MFMEFSLPRRVSGSEEQAYLVLTSEEQAYLVLLTLENKTRIFS